MFEAFQNQRLAWTTFLLVGVVVTVLFIWFLMPRKQAILPQQIQEKISENLDIIARYKPLPILSPEDDTYALICVIEQIDFLREGRYISIGDFDIRATGECGYFDPNDQRWSLTVALVIENRVELTTWTPKFETEEGSFAPSFIQEFFERSEDIKPGSVISASFNLPSPINRADSEGAQHHGEMVEQFYTQENINSFISTKDPQYLPNKLLIPFRIGVIPEFN